jgi:hypothetical protein
VWFEPRFLPFLFDRPDPLRGASMWVVPTRQWLHLFQSLIEVDGGESLDSFLAQDRLAASELLRQIGFAMRFGASLVFAAAMERSDANADIASFG